MHSLSPPPTTHWHTELPARYLKANEEKDRGMIQPPKALTPAQNPERHRGAGGDAPIRVLVGKGVWSEDESNGCLWVLYSAGGRKYCMRQGRREERQRNSEPRRPAGGKGRGRLLDSRRHGRCCLQTSTHSPHWEVVGLPAPLLNPSKPQQGGKPSIPISYLVSAI